MSRQRYEEYKESGVQWLGELPSHWEVKRLKYSTVSCQNGVWGEEPEGDENDIICIRVADFDREKIRVNLKNPTIRNIAATHRVSRAVQKGDLLLEKSGGGEKQPVGFVALYDEDQPAVCSNFVACMKLMPGMVPSFWRYVHAAGYSVGLNVRSIKQTSGIQNIDQASYLDERAPYPPPEEQQRIAAFLDRKTAEIDTLIAKKRRLLDRLAEKRTALITRAVTKGLTNLPGANLNAAKGGGPKGEGMDSPSNPDAPMKDSGIEWLGEIPAHWDVIAIKWITPVLRGASPRPIDDPIYFDDEGEYSWVRIADVTASEMRLEKTTQRLSELGASLSVKRHPGDLFLSIAGSVGKPIIAGIKCCIHDGFVYFPRLPPELSEYLFWIFKSGQPYLGLGKLGTQLNLNTDTVGGIRIALPPADEVHEIVDWISDSVERLDEIHERISNAIARLEEYRSALITNAVTGQIKVA